MTDRLMNGNEMDAEQVTIRRAWALAGAGALAVALVLALVDALAGRSGATLGWVDVAAAGLGAALLVAAAAGRRASAWLAAAAIAPITYLVLNTAPTAVTRDLMPVARLAVSLAAAVSYLAAAAPLVSRQQYGLCCGCLAVAGLFFMVWEPPPPKPVPIAKPLVCLKDSLLARMPGWTGEHQPLPEAIEQALGADEYLNLNLTSRDGAQNVSVFVTYSANAMSQIPHVPWVCMTAAGFRLVTRRQDELQHPAGGGREIKPNVIHFEPGPGMPRREALLFQYFNVGGEYEWNRQLARIKATSGAIGRKGSFLSQTQVAVYFPPSEGRDPLAKDSQAYRLGLQFLNAVIPLLEDEHYPDLGGTEGG